MRWLDSPRPDTCPACGWGVIYLGEESSCLCTLRRLREAVNDPKVREFQDRWDALWTNIKGATPTLPPEPAAADGQEGSTDPGDSPSTGAQRGLEVSPTPEEQGDTQRSRADPWRRRESNPHVS